MKEALGILTIILAFVGYGPYLKDTIAGKTKPHVVSWFLWTLVSFIAFGLQWSKGAGAGSYANLAMGFISLILLGLSFKNGIGQIKTIDVVSLVMAVMAIILWLIVDQPVWSVLLIVLIDALSFAPTFVKSWYKPEQETLSTWVLSMIRHGLVLLSLREVNMVTAAFSGYALTANALFCTLLIVRRRKRDS